MKLTEIKRVVRTRRKEKVPPTGFPPGQFELHLPLMTAKKFFFRFKNYSTAIKPARQMFVCIVNISIIIHISDYSIDLIAINSKTSKYFINTDN